MSQQVKPAATGQPAGKPPVRGRNAASNIPNLDLPTPPSDERLSPMMNRQNAGTGRGEEEGDSTFEADPDYAVKYEDRNQPYTGLFSSLPIITIGSRMLRGGPHYYSPCVLDRPEWENFFLTYPKDYDIRNDPVFDCKRSTYNRLMDIQHPVPEPTTSEMLRTGHCGPDPHSLTRGVFLRDRRELDLRPEPAYRMHLSDRTSLHYMRADPLEGVLPFGRKGDMTRAKSVSHRDFKWRVCCPVRPPCQPTMDRKVHRRARTDIHGRDYYNKVVKFEDDDTEAFFDQKMMKLKKAYWWPTNPITNETLGGHLLYHQDDPCMENRHEIWPCGEKDVLECNPICIPEDRCQVLAHRPKHKPKQYPLNFYNKSYLDMRYPYRNYECFEEVPDCCVKPEQFPRECCFTKGAIDMPCPKTGNQCPPTGPCPKVC